VHEVFPWGVAGVVMAPLRHGDLPRPLGVSVPNEHFALIGRAKWEAPAPAVPMVDMTPVQAVDGEHETIKFLLEKEEIGA
jgi:hypothetical protein